MCFLPLEYYSSTLEYDTSRVAPGDAPIGGNYLGSILKVQHWWDGNLGGAYQCIRGGSRLAQALSTTYLGTYMLL